jgi:hypothetical protein
MQAQDAKKPGDEKKPAASAGASTSQKPPAAKSGTETAKAPVVVPDTKPAPKSATKAAPPKKESQYASFWPSRFQMGVTYRGRLEMPSGRNYAADGGDGYYLNRLRLEALFKVNKYIDLFAMAQDSRVFEYNDPSKRPSGMQDTLDLRQAYIDIHGKLEKTSLAMRIGTQYLDLGSKRLVGVASWGNSPPVFDAAKFSFARPGVAADVFATTRVTTVNSYTFNEPKKGENLYGTYLSFDKLVPKAKIEPYVLWRTQPLVTDELKHKGDSDLITGGLRFFGKLQHGFDYTAEVVIQRGSYAQDDVSAWAGSWGMGYTIGKSIRKPRLLFEYNYASGDKTKGDGSRGTFDQLYAVNHSYYGIADCVGWRNTSNYKIGLEVEATKRLKIQFDVNDFYLATLQDAYYTDNGNAVVTNTKATSKHIGLEPDLQVTYKLSKMVNVGGGYGRLIPGTFLKQSTAGHPYNYPYIFWEFKY